MEKYSRDGEREEEEGEGEGEESSDRDAHQAWTVSGKWESVVPPSSSRCQGCGIPNYGCKFCTTASRLIIPELSFRSPFFIAALCASFHLVCFTFFLSFSPGCSCSFFLWAFMSLFSALSYFYLCGFYVIHLKNVIIQMRLSVELHWSLLPVGCNCPLNAHTPSMFKPQSIWHNHSCLHFCCSISLPSASQTLNGLSPFWSLFIASDGRWRLDISHNVTNLKFPSSHLCLDTGEILWLTSSSGLNALIFHAVQGLLCNLQAQHFSGQYLNYVPAGHSLIQAGSSRFHEKK